jgi:hypothetical protein
MTDLLHQMYGRETWNTILPYDEARSSDNFVSFSTDRLFWQYDKSFLKEDPLLTWVRGYTNFYPFDTRTQTFYVWVDLSTPSGHLLSLAPNIGLWMEFPNWRKNVRFSKQLVEKENTTRMVTVVNITLKRPIGLRILTIVLLTAVLASILLLIVVPETGTVLEVAIGILLGLWGIQGVLIPPDINANTLVHFAILALYILLAWALAVRFLGRPIWLRLRQKYAPLPQTAGTAQENVTPLRLRPIRSSRRKQGVQHDQ